MFYSIIAFIEFNVTHIDVYRKGSTWKIDAVVEVSMNHYYIQHS